MLTMESAALAVFGPAPPTWLGCNEGDRLAALRAAADALESLELLGLRCGVFGSSLRPGDFFHHSDIDIAAWLPGREPIGSDLALRARLECHRALGSWAFDLVLLPCANAAFEERIVHGWSRSRDEVLRASAGAPMLDPIRFGPADVAFIDSDRLDIATRAGARMAKTAAESTGPRAALSLCASMQTIVRVAEKCAKDVLREFASTRPARGVPLPLYPILAYPCERLGGSALASPSSLALYFECCSLLEPPEAAGLAHEEAWRSRCALLAQLFCASMRTDFAPALAAMARMEPTR